MSNKTPKLESRDTSSVDHSPTPSPTTSSSPKSNHKRGSSDNTVSTPTNKKSRKSPASSGATGSPAGIKGKDWTEDIKSAVMDRVITMGASAGGIAKLAEEFGLDRQSVKNALAPNLTWNMRGKAVSAVRK